MKLRLAFFALALPLLAVGGCASLGNLGSAIGAAGTVLSLNTPQFLDNDRLYKIHLTYDTFAVASDSLRKNVPQCLASQAPSVSALCVKRDTLVALQIAVRQAGSTLDNIDDWAANNPTIDASALIDGLTRIVNQGTVMIAAANAGRG